MAARRSQIDRAIEKVTTEIRTLDQVLQRLIAERDAKTSKPAKPRIARPVAAKAAGE